MGHPIFQTYKMSLTKRKPEQSTKQTISEFFNQYLDYLQLRAFIENNPNNLNDEDELESFMLNLQHSTQYLELTYLDRHSPNTSISGMFSQNQLVATLETYSHRVNALLPTAPTSSPRARVSFTSNVQPKTLQYPSNRARTPPKPSSRTK